MQTFMRYPVADHITWFCKIAYASEMGQIVSYLFGDEPADPQLTRRPHSAACQPVTHDYQRPTYDYQRPTYENTWNLSTSRSWNTACQKVTKIQVDVRRDSCRTATVHWQQACSVDSQVDITVTDVTGNSRRPIPKRYRRPATERKFRIPTELTRGNQYEVIIRGVTSSVEGTTRFRAVFTPLEMQTLHNMAVNHVKRGGRSYFQQCDVFYRNKPFAYFMGCQTNNNIMTVYMKDNNGDPASIINGQIKGLFFAMSVDPQTGQPPDWSFFGPKRVSIPATTMLTRHSNLYFADFYCNDKAHYVTVVLTRPGSDTDHFCEGKLIKLDTGHNDFLFRNNRDKVFVTKKVWVELLFTEDVDLSSPSCSFSVVEGRGTSRPGGLPKNPNCDKCNLPYPLITTAQSFGY
ncbi:hypothetical protein LSAT2_014524 [Lamellibrachia satsuma]|nr:hypothetical protein LSAT2_014524 [Lamellibrachia satsuma]